MGAATGGKRGAEAHGELSPREHADGNRTAMRGAAPGEQCTAGQAWGDQERHADEDPDAGERPGELQGLDRFESWHEKHRFADVGSPTGR